MSLDCYLLHHCLQDKQAHNIVILVGNRSMDVSTKERALFSPFSIPPPSFDIKSAYTAQLLD